MWHKAVLKKTNSAMLGMSVLRIFRNVNNWGEKGYKKSQIPEHYSHDALTNCLQYTAKM